MEPALQCSGHELFDELREVIIVLLRPVGAAAAVEEVDGIVAAGEEGVGPVAAVESVAAGAAGQNIVAGVADEQVVAAVAGQRVVAAAAAEGVGLRAAGHAVAAAAADDFLVGVVNLV